MVLNRGSAAEPPTLDPTLGAGSLAAPIIADLFSGLLDRGPDGTLVPGVAESWTVSEDGRTYTFVLREGLRWSDGRELTADDFVYSYRRLLDPATASRLVGLFTPIRNARAITARQQPPDSLGVGAPDDRTVVFELEQRTPYFLELVGNVRVAPVPRHVIEAEGRAWTRPGKMVGNGAFVLSARVPQSYLRLDKNPRYHDAQAVRLDQVVWHPTQNLATSFKRFRAGELDIVLNFPPAEIDWIRENLGDSLHITANLGVYFLVLNTGEPPFDDLRVRQALSLAVDRDAIANRLLRTGVRPAYGFVTPAITDYDGVEIPERQLEFPARQARARELLAAAGYGPGKPLEVSLIYDTNEENRKVMVAIAAMWQAIGVRTAITDVEFRMLNRQIRTRDYGVARWFYIASFDDPYAMLQLFTSNNPNNWPNWRSAEFDELLAASNQVMDRAERLALLADAERLMLSQHPVLPISFYVGRRLVSPRVGGWIDSPRGPPLSRYLWLE
ncbi:MAG: peptide ABC transporter substrate-binding protein [Chromatiales bacterium]|nr:MAG: peptide ABC transporter substrate-binding protein [Chromatiales bacterium]